MRKETPAEISVRLSRFIHSLNDCSKFKMHINASLMIVSAWAIKRKIAFKMYPCVSFFLVESIIIQCEKFFKYVFYSFPKPFTLHPQPRIENLLIFDNWTLLSKSRRKRLHLETNVPVHSGKSSLPPKLVAWFQFSQILSGLVLLLWADMEKPHLATSKRLKRVPRDFKNLLACHSLKTLHDLPVDRICGVVV